MQVIDAGHIYRLKQLDTDDTVDLKFVKRNSSTVIRDEEHAGLQTQEVIRALIDRTKFLNELIPCVESQDAIYHLRQALYMYEVRAYLRKQQGKNRMGDHEEISPKRHRQSTFNVPFDYVDIEDYEIGLDDHILTEEN